MKDRATRNFSLKVKTYSKALSEAKDAIEEGITGEQMGLLTRWDKINDRLLGGMRFGNVYLIAGASGHGKSFILNMILQDFIDPKINGNFKKPFKILHFTFEMSAVDEVLRTLSGKTSLAYGDLLSAHGPLSDFEFDRVKKEIDALINDTRYFVETTGNRDEIEEDIGLFIQRYPDHELVICLDHTLMVNEHDEKSEVGLMASLGKMFIDIRKEFNTLNILLCQLNDKIEDPRRLSNPSMHYPTKTDIHGSKQLYHAADGVFVIHRPELLHLDFYGPKRHEVNGLIAFHILKFRKGQPGMTRLREDLGNGAIHTW